MIQKNRVRRGIPGLAFLLPILALATANEILIYQGPEFTSPGLTAAEELTFRKEFPVTDEVWRRQPVVHSPGETPPLPAERAIELARAGIDEARPEERILTKLELVVRRKDDEPKSPQVAYYLIEFQVRGSEVHRVVLMDGTVVKSRLRRIDRKK